MPWFEVSCTGENPGNFEIRKKVHADDQYKAVRAVTSHNRDLLGQGEKGEINVKDQEGTYILQRLITDWAKYLGIVPDHED